MLIDSHVHLQDKKFARDLDRVLSRAEDAGIERLICVGDRIDSSRKAISLCRRHPRLVSSIGLHPHHAAQFGPTSLVELEALARDPSVVAVGEIGLDYHYPNSSPENQREVFVRQAHMAGRHDLPIIIHCRDAYDDLLGIIRGDAKIPRRGVIHCFSGDYEQACQFIEMGYLLGVGGAISYPNGTRLREVIQRVGLEHIISETDAPYLPHQSKRGRRNEPSYMKFTIKSLADLTDMTYQDAARVTKANAIRLFNLPDAISPDIIYSIRKTLYLCVTNDCTNACSFCQRCHDYMIMGHLLKLDREPTAEQLIERIENPNDYREIVISGLGEPTMRWDVCLEVARRLKEMGATVRLNTNGQGSLINGRDIVPEMAGLFDSVSITMLGHDKASHDRVAMPSDPDRAWDAVIEFAQACREAVPDVVMAAVAVPDLDVEAMRALAEDQFKLRFRIREYRPKGFTELSCAC